MDLMGRDALFRGCQQEQRRQPLGQWDFGTLENRLDRDRELLAAARALVEARAMAVTLQLGHVIVCRATVRAYRAIRPNPCL